MPTRLSEATILVVDDEHSLRHLLVRQLREGGYHVLEASYGMEALEVARNSPTPISLVLSDVQMPGMLGTDLAPRLVAEHPGAHIVFMSAHPLDELTSVSDSAGIVRVITKPFEGQKLMALVKLVLGPPTTPAETSTAEHMRGALGPA